jgi:hypothetical protein
MSNELQKLAQRLVKLDGEAWEEGELIAYITSGAIFRGVLFRKESVAAC